MNYKNTLSRASVLILAALLSWACTSTLTAEQQTPVEVTFSISPLTYEVEPITKAGTTSGADIGTVVNTIGYKLFKVSTLVGGDEVSFDPATETAPEGFGNFTARILPGSYQIYFYAYGEGGGSVNIVQNSTNTSGIYVLGSDKEQFTKMLNYDITASTGNVAVSLPRTSGKLTIRVNDNAPTEVARVTYSAVDYCKQMESSVTTVYQQPWAANATINGDRSVAEFTRHIPNPKNPTALTISLYDSSNTLLNQFVANVPIYANRNTIVSGDLFTNLGQRSLSITIEDTWGEDYTYNLE